MEQVQIAKSSEVIEACNLVDIAGGEFLRGDAIGVGFAQEGPSHAVLVDDFMIGKYAVTAKEYAAFINDESAFFDELWCDFIDPCLIHKQGKKYSIAKGAENYPMIQVSYVGAIAYCNWLSNKFGLENVYDLKTLNSDTSKNGIRLLKEAEWEFACRGPELNDFSHGKTPSTDLVNYNKYEGEFSNKKAGFLKVGAFGLYEYSPVPVGTFPANGYGLYEMNGNVNEWCHDSYCEYKDQSYNNPEGNKSSFKVIRGGSFMDGMEKQRPSYRHAIHFNAKCMIDGFRIGSNKF
ncbi:MAG: SUMF1/EgtB/PvdO family nonheme iron enzyme [Crocinitomix sp.]|nr:SUMF1/EgtB/PvdO family nonheme iron enzyme [Crocinitomix sp.]